MAVVAVDPTRRRSGGALLGDRIRMNSLAAPNVFMRSLATRRQHLATSAVLADVIALYRAVGFDLVVVETAGIGQSDTEIVDVADLSLYVMTAEYGAASQLEKIDMLDFADMIVLNKFEKRGAEDALRDVRKQWRRNHPDRMKLPDEEVPVFPTIASRFNDPGVNRLFLALCARARRRMRRAGPLDHGRWRRRSPWRRPSSSRAIRWFRPRGRDTSRKSPRADARSTARPRAVRMRRAAPTASIYRCRRSTIRSLPEPLAAAPATPAKDPALDALRAAYNRALDDVGAEALASAARLAGPRAGA